ncbi:hypothetical protein BDZ89DRAFT_1140432 [Hymenopellis radicata]|nr:hypothetical protein BDZ89DRAFT_1141408 [Hymenopellis radicata]KAF9017878.1 hypothetical protein BDZ89DRAFT_1140432 [Hymenopellis radicata]
MPPPTPAEYVDPELPGGVQPRINGKRMISFIGKDVRIPCRVTVKDIDHTLITAHTSDDFSITIDSVDQADFDSLQVGQCVEVVATVVDENNIIANTLIAMPGDIDFAIVDAVIELIHQERFFRRIFVPFDYA